MDLLKFCCSFCDLDFVHLNFKVIQYLRLTIVFKACSQSIFSNFVAALQSGHTVFSGFLLYLPHNIYWLKNSHSKDMNLTLGFQARAISICDWHSRTRQIIRYRATATLRRPAKKSNIQPQNRGGGLQNQQEHHIILTKYEAVHPTAISENNSSSGMLII